MHPLQALSLPACWRLAVVALLAALLSLPGGVAEAAETHVVRQGDTLSAIARAHGLTGGWQALYTANRNLLSDPNVIYTGQRLALPGRSSATASRSSSRSAGVACPVDAPRRYSDTWGAARSGGRSHKGTDIMASRGTPIRAYESGRVSRLSRNTLGGVVLYLQGDSGNRYYYAHLDGYASGLRAGQRVDAGQHIAYTGSSGNASASAPHLHFEVRPGGGSQVNPHPYVRKACG